MLEGCVPYPGAFVKRYREKGYWTDRTLGEEFDKSVRKHAQREALTFQGQSLTYQELGEKVNRLALHFIAMGLRTYDRAVLQLPNELEFACCFFALVKIGVIPIMALPAHQESEISFFAEFTRARAHFVPSVFKKLKPQEMARSVRKRCPSLEYTFVSGEGVEAGSISLSKLLRDRIEERVALSTLVEYRPDPLEPALFQLSGGTTGIPKIIPRTHNDYALNFREAARITRLSQDSVMGIAIPVNHNFALSSPGLLGTIYKGGRIVLIPSTKTDVVLETIERERITIMPTPPTLLIRWMNSEEIGKYDLSSLEILLAGGAKLNPEVARKIRPLLGCDFHQNLGMAEGMLFWTRRNDPEDILLNTQGAPMLEDDEIRVVDESDKDVPAGEVGELLVRGPYTIRGYFNSPEYNKKAFTEDGFYRTGDLVKSYRDRYVSVEGRVKDTINRGGEKISAEEVENHILAHPKVKDCALVAMPDPELGEKGCAFVVTKEGRGLSFEELIRFLREERNIAVFKLPERLEVVEELPTTKVGKVDKKELRRIIAEKISH